MYWKNKIVVIIIKHLWTLNILRFQLRYVHYADSIAVLWFCCMELMMIGTCKSWCRISGDFYQLWHGLISQDKVKAATNLINRLKSKKGALVTAVSQLCEAYTDLAYHDVSAFRKQLCKGNSSVWLYHVPFTSCLHSAAPIKLPSSCPLLKVGKLKTIPIPTMDIQVTLHHDYSKYSTHQATFTALSLVYCC